MQSVMLLYTVNHSHQLPECNHYLAILTTGYHNLIDQQKNALQIYPSVFVMKSYPDAIYS